MDPHDAIDTILDYYEHPRHHGPLADATISGEAYNPGCGDLARVHARISADGIIDAISFEGQGCTISMAAASLWCELAEGQPLGDVLALDEHALADRLGSALVSNRPTCVTLALRALRAAAGPSG